MCEGVSGCGCVLVRVCVCIAYIVPYILHTSTFREQGVEQLVLLFPMVTDPLQERIRIPCPHETLGGTHHT